MIISMFFIAFHADFSTSQVTYGNKSQKLRETLVEFQLKNKVDGQS